MIRTRTRSGSVLFGVAPWPATFRVLASKTRIKDYSVMLSHPIGLCACLLRREKDQRKGRIQRWIASRQKGKEQETIHPICCRPDNCWIPPSERTPTQNGVAIEENRTKQNGREGRWNFIAGTLFLPIPAVVGPMKSFASVHVKFSQVLIPS